SFGRGVLPTETVLARCVAAANPRHFEGETCRASRAPHLFVADELKSGSRRHLPPCGQISRASRAVLSTRPQEPYKKRRNAGRSWDNARKTTPSWSAGSGVRKRVGDSDTSGDSIKGETQYLFSAKPAFCDWGQEQQRSARWQILTP